MASKNREWFLANNKQENWDLSIITARNWILPTTNKLWRALCTSDEIVAPANTLVQPGEILSREVSYSIPRLQAHRNCEIVSLCCFKLLNCIICYSVIETNRTRNLIYSMVLKYLAWFGTWAHLHSHLLSKIFREILLWLECRLLSLLH